MNVGGVRLCFDSNLNHDKRMPCAYPQRGDRTAMPGTLVRAFHVQARSSDGTWRTVYRTDENTARLVRIPLGESLTGLSLVCESTWGQASARVFGFEPTHELPEPLPHAIERPTWADRVARVPAADLAPPPLADAGGRGHGA